MIIFAMFARGIFSLIVFQLALSAGLAQQNAAPSASDRGSTTVKDLGPDGPYESRRRIATRRLPDGAEKARSGSDAARSKGSSASSQSAEEGLKEEGDTQKQIREADLLELQYRDEGVLFPILPSKEGDKLPPGQAGHGRSNLRRPADRLDAEDSSMQDFSADGDVFDNFGLNSPDLSRVEQILLGRFPSELFREFKQFGYEAFQPRLSNKTGGIDGSTAQGFLNESPAGPDYILGPGDEVYLVAWGSASFSLVLSVKQDGTVFLPRVGAVKVGGKTLKAASDLLQKRLSASYNGIKMRLNLETARNIPLYVVGEVEQPGMYFVPATAGIVNALMQAQGVKKSGSLRRVEVVRANKTVHKVDLYNFLVKGTAPSVDLQPNDVILVPVLQNVAAVAGNARRPAIYELTDDTTLFDLLQLAGGLSFAGHAGRVSLERVVGNKERVTQDFDLPANFSDLTFEEAMKGSLRQRVIDGDVIKIFPVSSEIRKTVYLRGHVRRPGSYELKEGMKVSQLIPNFDVLLAEPYTTYVQVLRTVPPRDEKQSIFVNLERVLAGETSEDVVLQERDEIIVFSKAELDLRDRVSISGKVNKPGAFYYFSGMKLRDLLFMAGNITRDANVASAEIARYTEVGNEFKVERLQFNLKEVLSNPPLNNPDLMPRDKVLIQGVQNFEIDNTVSLLGEVKYPGTYSFMPGERLSAVIKRAGGFGPRAFLPGAVFTRVSVRDLQQRALNEQVTRLESEILQQDINPTLRFQSSEDRAATLAASAGRQALLDNMRKAQASGRMVVRISELSSFAESRYDLPLEGGDSLSIPPIPSSVNVLGEVYTPTSMIFLPRRNIGHYLNMAGGPTSNADRNSIFLIRADGTVISRQQNRGFLLRSFYNVEVERGDSIFVPKDITRFSWLSATKDITEIIFQIATTTGITIAAFR